MTLLHIPLFDSTSGLHTSSSLSAEPVKETRRLTQAQVRKRSITIPTERGLNRRIENNR